MDFYKGQAQQLLEEAQVQVSDLASKETSLAKYLPELDNAKRKVKAALGTDYLGNLVIALDSLLNDTGSDKEPVRPALKDLWERSKLTPIKRKLKEFHDTVLYGDPLVVSRRVGKGKVVACMTAAGTDPGAAGGWDNWGGGSPAALTYPMFMMDLQRYLTSEGDDLNRLVGDTIVRTLDATRYKAEGRATLQPQPDPDAKDNRGAQPTLINLGPFTMDTNLKDNTLNFTFNSSKRPGVYTFEFTPVGPGGVEGQPEASVYAFNVDAASESNLKRAAQDKLERVTNNKDPKAGKISLRSFGDSFEKFRNRQPDASESPWLYLFFILVLVMEQALAVHLSFHLKGNESSATTRTGQQPAAA